MFRFPFSSFVLFTLCIIWKVRKKIKEKRRISKIDSFSLFLFKNPEKKKKQTQVKGFNELKFVSILLGINRKIVISNNTKEETIK